MYVYTAPCGVRPTSRALVTFKFFVLHFKVTVNDKVQPNARVVHTKDSLVSHDSFPGARLTTGKLVGKCELDLGSASVRPIHGSF